MGGQEAIKQWGQHANLDFLTISRDSAFHHEILQERLQEVSAPTAADILKKSKMIPDARVPERVI